MINYQDKVIGEIEIHSVAGIRDCFENGVDPNDIFQGKPLIYELISEYARGPKFRECVELFIDFGLKFEDDVLLAVLLDDVKALENMEKEESVLKRKYHLKVAYTPIEQASLLHICAEFNHLKCGEYLLKRGLDVNTRSGLDKEGYGGQTPIFHAVNQNQDQSREMMELLLDHKANLNITVKGIIWGKDYPWETLIPSVNPVSYAMMGLLPQMHRDEKTISEVVSKLLEYEHGEAVTLRNVPNKYLNH